MHAALAADAEDWHNVRVVQVGRRLGLVLEALELLGIERCRKRQDLEGDPAVERQLLGFIDDPHTPAAEFSEEAEITQLPQRRSLFRQAMRPGAKDRSPLLDQVQAG